MRPMQWHKKRTKLSMPRAAELTLDMMSECDQALKVTDIVHLSHLEEIASITTIYSGVNWLVANKFLAIGHSPISKAKVYALTPKAHRYLGMETHIS